VSLSVSLYQVKHKCGDLVDLRQLFLIYSRFITGKSYSETRISFRLSFRFSRSDFYRFFCCQSIQAQLVISTLSAVSCGHTNGKTASWQRGQAVIRHSPSSQTLDQWFQFGNYFDISQFIDSNSFVFSCWPFIKEFLLNIRKITFSITIEIIVNIHFLLLS